MPAGFVWTILLFSHVEGLPFVVAGCAGGGEPPTHLASYTYIDGSNYPAVTLWSFVKT
jgi:hypothetical protein